MNVVSLHPFEPGVVRRYVEALNGGTIDAAWSGWFQDELREAVAAARAGNERAANRLSLGLAYALGNAGPVFTYSAFGFSFWEAQVDRPLGMLMRPPSRLFTEAGLDSSVARAMPVRLDRQEGMMGGAYIPARLIGQALAVLDDHMERSVKRLVAAEYDPVAAYGLMHEALSFAGDQQLGLYEAMDVVGPDGQGGAGMALVRPDARRLDRDLAARIDAYRQPPAKPGLLQRLFGRGAASNGANGHIPKAD